MIKARNIIKSYQNGESRFQVLKDISLDIEDISGPIRIIQWDEKQYVWFYTSSLLSGESTGYFHQIDISQQNKDTIYEVNLFMQTSYIQREPSDVFQTLQHQTVSNPAGNTSYQRD